MVLQLGSLFCSLLTVSGQVIPFENAGSPDGFSSSEPVHIADAGIPLPNGTIILDDFQSPDGFSGAGPLDITQTGLSETVGGQRRIVISGSGNVTIYSFENSNVPFNLQYNRSSPGDFKVSYGSAGSPLHLNLVPGFQDRFRVGALVNLASETEFVNLTLKVVDGAGIQGSVSRPVNFYTPALTILFSEFPGVNFGNIAEMELSYANDGPNTGYRFQQFAVLVPEPSEWSLAISASLFLVGIVVRLRQRRLT
jgi:hypothetical protein